MLVFSSIYGVVDGFFVSNWGLDGIWPSIILAEVPAVLVTVLFLLGKRKRYHY